MYALELLGDLTKSILNPTSWDVELRLNLWTVGECSHFSCKIGTSFCCQEQSSSSLRHSAKLAKFGGWVDSQASQATASVEGGAPSRCKVWWVDLYQGLQSTWKFNKLKIFLHCEFWWNATCRRRDGHSIRGHHIVFISLMFNVAPHSERSYNGIWVTLHLPYAGWHSWYCSIHTVLWFHPSCVCATRICRTGRRWIGLSRGSPWVWWGKHVCSA